MFCVYTSFFFNDTATTEIYTLSLHDALPICDRPVYLQVSRGDLVLHLSSHHDDGTPGSVVLVETRGVDALHAELRDRKSTRLNSSHANISYAVFCLKKKKKMNNL